MRGGVLQSKTVFVLITVPLIPGVLCELTGGWWSHGERTAASIGGTGESGGPARPSPSRPDTDQM